MTLSFNTLLTIKTKSTKLKETLSQLSNTHLHNFLNLSKQNYISILLVLKALIANINIQIKYNKDLKIRDPSNEIFTLDICIQNFFIISLH